MVKLLVLLAVVACQSKRMEDTSGGSGSVPEPRSDAHVGSGSAAAPDDVPLAVADAGAPVEEPDPVEPGKLIAELGAIPAWQGVVDRAQLLGRRNLRGVVYGRIGPAIVIPGPAQPPSDAGPPVDAGLVASPYVWLVDDTDGNGSLGIRVALAGKVAQQGDRVALGGAWHLDDERRWYWKVESLQALPPAVPSDLTDPPAPEPSHAISMGNVVAGGRMISFARDGDAVYFQIVGPTPANDGDGWLVANELGDKPFAMLTLPGERPSYGGQDMRGPDERWQLKRAQTYPVRIGKIRQRGPDKPALIHARTAPVRVN
jgi:hypothetical protein